MNKLGLFAFALFLSVNGYATPSSHLPKAGTFQCTGSLGTQSVSLTLNLERLKQTAPDLQDVKYYEGTISGILFQVVNMGKHAMSARTPYSVQIYTDAALSADKMTSSSFGSKGGTLTTPVNGVMATVSCCTWERHSSTSANCTY